MKLFKTSVFSAIITLVRISASFAASKIIAFFAGPSGLAVIGQFYSLTSIFVGFSNGGIGTGVVKFTAEYENDKNKQNELFSTAIKVSVYCSVILGILIVLFSKLLSKSFFESSAFIWPVRWFGITLVFYALNSVLLSIINGKRQIKFYTIINCVGSLISLILTILLVFKYEITGALYAVVFSQFFVFLVTLWFVYNQPWFELSLFTKPINKIVLGDLGQYSLMALIAAISLPLTQLILRNLIIQHNGLASAGLWQGMNRISDGYLMIITISLSTYFVPKLAGADDEIIRKEVWNGYKLILPLVIISSLVIYFSRSFIIRILYTNEFLEMEKLFLFQLLGDFFKISSFLLATLLSIKKLTKIYIFSEVFFSILYIVLAFYFLNSKDLIGITQAYFVAYLVSFICLFIFFRKLLLNI
ncbi:MAG: O-antigen translocase [Sphingobacterium sp.]